MIRRATVLLLSASLAAPGCATMRAQGVAVVPAAAPQTADRAAIAEYVQRIPPGSEIRLDLSDRTSLRATLLKATEDSVLVQARTRIPEPPFEIPMSRIVRVTLDRPGGTNLGKAVAIGVAAGVVAATAVFLIIAAVLSD